MNLDLLFYQSQLIKFAYKNFPDLVQKMKETGHSIGPTYEEQKFFHLEDSIWTHTLLVMNNCIANPDMIDLSGKIHLLVAFCHDFGKIKARLVHIDKITRAVFHNHGPMGVSLALEFLLKYQEEAPWLTDEIICKIISVISNHSKFYDLPISRAVLMGNGDRLLEEMYKYLCIHDYYGRIPDYSLREKYVKQIEENKKKYESFATDTRCTPRQPLMFPKNVYLICGPSNVGKDTEAKNRGINKVYSFDKIRVATYVQSEEHKKLISTPGYNHNSIDLYRRAYAYSLKNLESTHRFDILINQVVNGLSNENTVAICNTFCKEKYRKPISRIIKEKFHDEVGVHVIYLLSSKERIYQNASKNTEKEIGRSVLDSFIGFQSIPTRAEGYDSVSVILKR